jgi:hypothetical protein
MVGKIQPKLSGHGDKVPATNRARHDRLRAKLLDHKKSPQQPALFRICLEF